MKINTPLYAVVAVYEDWGIGSGGTQPVSLSADRKHFRWLTTGNAVIVGRKTLLDFPGGKPLPNRTNIVLTHENTEIPGAFVVNTPEQALCEAAKYPKTLVIGGGSVYRQFLPYVKTVYVTKLFTVPVSDTFFPNLDSLPEWQIAESTPVSEEQGIRYSFITYTRV